METIREGSYLPLPHEVVIYSSNHQQLNIFGSYLLTIINFLLKKVLNPNLELSVVVTLASGTGA